MLYSLSALALYPYLIHIRIQYGSGTRIGLCQLIWINYLLCSINIFQEVYPKILTRSIAIMILSNSLLIIVIGDAIMYSNRGLNFKVLNFIWFYTPIKLTTSALWNIFMKNKWWSSCQHEFKNLSHFSGLWIYRSLQTLCRAPHSKLFLTFAKFPHGLMILIWLHKMLAIKWFKVIILNKTKSL